MLLNAFKNVTLRGIHRFHQNNYGGLLKAVHVRISRTCDMLYYMQRRIKDADRIKVDNQLTLKWGHDFGESWWAQCNHRVFIHERGGQDQNERGCV